MSRHGFDDLPPNSRLFVTCEKDATEDELRSVFSPFGTIDDLWFIQPSSRSASSTTICYVKYSKSSEALKAIESINLLRRGKDSDEDEEGAMKKVLKVVLAASKKDGNVYRGRDGTDNLDRLHLTIKKEDTEETITEEFSQFGKVVDVMIVRGLFAYVSMSSAYEAAVALESCAANKSRFRPCIAEPRPPRGVKREASSASQSPWVKMPSSRRGDRYRDDRRSGGYGGADADDDDYRPHPNGIGSFGRRGGGASDYRYDGPPATYDRRDAVASDQRPRSAAAYAAPPIQRHQEGLIDLSASLINNPTRCTGLFMKINYPMTREAIFKLCNLVPDLATVEIHQEAATLQMTIAYVRYESATAAAWAWQKFQDFEYPPNFVLRVRYADAGFPKDWQMEYNLKTGFSFSAPAESYAPAAMAPTARSGAPMSRAPVEYGYPAPAPARGPPAPPVPPAQSDYSSSTAAFQYGHGERESYGAGSGSRAYANHSTVSIGSPKPTLPRSTPYVDRCFFSTTNRLSPHYLEEIFSSFGDYIEAYYLSGRNCGYVLFGSEGAAVRASETLNGEKVYGELFKVVRADPEPPAKYSQE